jgi:hypothetical protein
MLFFRIPGRMFSDTEITEGGKEYSSRSRYSPGQENECNLSIDKTEKIIFSPHR